MRGWDDFKPGLSQDFQGLANVDGTQGQMATCRDGDGEFFMGSEINNSEEISPGGRDPGSNDLDLDPDIIKIAPVLQEWLQDIPDIAR